jgi:hypothetical protein
VNAGISQVYFSTPHIRAVNAEHDLGPFEKCVKLIRNLLILVDQHLHPYTLVDLNVHSMGMLKTTSSESRLPFAH